MITFTSFVSKYFSGFRNTLLIGLLLLSGNYHQALVKYDRDTFLDVNYDVIFTPAIIFNPDYEHYLEENLDELLSRRRFNGSVMIAHHGQVVYQKTMGFANVLKQKPFQEEHNVFQLASVGKQFTAISVAMLQEKGLLSFDDLVTEHIHDFPYPQITIRQLLNHTSGLQNYMYLVDQYWTSENLPTQDDLLQLFLDKNLPLNFTPGRRFSYSNTGYAFLALLVQYVSGQNFADFVQHEIFSPLGMNNSFVFQPVEYVPEAILPYLVAGHERVGRSSRVIPFGSLDGIVGDKGVFSCMEDLLKWNNALNNYQLVSEQTLSKAFERGQLRSGYAINYGFGYRIRKEADNDITYHNGWWRGFRTSYIRLPDNSLVVILNNTNASINGLERQIRNILNNCPYDVLPQEEIQLALSDK